MKKEISFSLQFYSKETIRRNSTNQYQYLNQAPFVAQTSILLPRLFYLKLYLRVVQWQPLGQLTFNNTVNVWCFKPKALKTITKKYVDKHKTCITNRVCTYFGNGKCETQEVLLQLLIWTGGNTTNYNLH